MPLERSVSHLLHRASQAAEALFAGRDAITPRQIVLLGCVAENEGLSQAKPRQEMFLAGLAAIARLGRENGDRPGGQHSQQLLVDGLQFRRMDR